MLERDCLRVLGIDFSLNGTGLAVYSGESICDYYVYSVKKASDDHVINIPKFNEQADKIDFVCQSIMEVIKYSDIDFICMEEHTGSYYSWMDGYAILKHLFRVNEKSYIMVSPSALKKYVISGKADKNQMAYQLRTEYGFDFDYLGECADNIVDASWLAILVDMYYRKFIFGQKYPNGFSKDRVASLEKIMKGKNNKWQLCK